MVSGTVTMNGTPIQNARLTFMRKKEAGWSRHHAKTNADGTFSVVDSELKGIEAGEHVVIVEKYSDKHEASAMRYAAKGKLHLVVFPTVLPGNYNSVKDTPFKVQIKNGKNDFRLDVKSGKN